MADAYVEALTAKAKRLRLGDPYREDVQLGPIVNEKQLARVDGIVQRSIAGGARLVEGGTHEGLFYRPTVLADVTTDLPAWTDEIFGPVAPVTTFETDDEAIALANASEYGLVAADLHAVDLARAGAREPDQGRHDPRQRWDAQRRGDHPVRRDG